MQIISTSQKKAYIHLHVQFQARCFKILCISSYMYVKIYKTTWLYIVKYWYTSSIKFNHLHNISCHPLIPFWTHANNAIWLSCLAIFMCVFSCKLFHHHHHHHHYQWCKTFPIIPSTSRWPLNLSPWWTVYLRYHGYCLYFRVYYYSAESPESLLIQGNPSKKYKG